MVGPPSFAIARSGGYDACDPLSAKVRAGFCEYRAVRQRSCGGDMLLKAALVLLALWLAAVLFPFELGSLVHVLLLAGLMMVLLGALKARDAAARHAGDSAPGKR
jgi:hypothetical protein